MTGTALIMILIALIVIFYMLYAGLITSRNKVHEAFSGVDVQLKKRHDLIPNLLTLAKKYMEYEGETLAEITALRSQASKMDTDSGEHIKQKLELENQLQGKMNSFMLSVEAYPDLKASEAFSNAMEAYEDIEEHIAAARRFYNSAVNVLKNKIEIFPTSVIAKWLGIKYDMPFFEASAKEKEAVNASDYL